MTENFVVTGMTCSACSAHVERAVSKVDGVETVAVNLMTGRMSVTFDESRTSPAAICDAVAAGGYGAELASNTDAHRQQERQDEATRAMKRRLLLSVCFLVPLFYLSMGHMMGWPLPHAFHASFPLFTGVQIMLLIPILIVNRSYFTVGFSRLFRGAPNMDSLVALGAAAGIVYSVITIFTYDGSGMPELYFESAPRRSRNSCRTRRYPDRPDNAWTRRRRSPARRAASGRRHSCAHRPPARRAPPAASCCSFPRE